VPTGESATTGSYVDDRQMVEALRAAVAMVPPRGAADQMSARRIGSVLDPQPATGLRKGA